MNIFETSAASDGGLRATESAHRKIELQAPADLTYLIANVSRAARQKIDKHFPPGAAPEGEDRMRERVEMLVDDYIKNTFVAAKSNLSINGMDSKEMDAELAKVQEGEEFEPFDTRLAARIQALSSQIENQTLQLAELRRNAPVETAQRFRESFAKENEMLDTELQRDEDLRTAKAKETRLPKVDIDRLDEVQQNWQQSTDDLLALRTGLGTAITKMERAQKAVDYVAENR